MTDLTDRVALVTGAASGIGRATAVRFAEAGADLVLADLRTEPREGGRPIDERLPEARFVETDVTAVADLRAAVDEAVETFGGLDAMVNNAGIYPGDQPADGVEPADLDRVLAVNLRGVYFGSTVAAAAMREGATGGSIVNLSSVAGLRGFPGATTYCASKGGVSNLTRALAAEFGPDGIRVNAIAPGVIETAMTTEDAPVAGSMTDRIPLGRDGRPAEVADAALYLASEASSYVTGHNLVVDGGLTV